MIGYPSLHNPHTSRSSPPAPVPPSLVHTFLLALLSLLPFLSPHATSASTPILLPTTLLRDTFAPSGYLPYILCTSSSLPSSHAALLPSLAVPLYLDSPIGRVLPPHTPSTLLAALFPRRGMPRSLLPSSCTLYLIRAQICCSPLPTSFASLPPHHLNVCPGTRHCNGC